MNKMQNRDAIRRLEKAVSTAEYGTRYPFSELTLLAGVDVVKHRSVIACANRHLMRHHDRCLTNIRGIGYRVDPSDHAPSLAARELGIPPRDYRIAEVSQLDDGKGGSPALLVVYEEAQGSPQDSAVVNHLLGKRKQG